MELKGTYFFGQAHVKEDKTFLFEDTEFDDAVDIDAEDDDEDHESAIASEARTAVGAQNSRQIVLGLSPSTLVVLECD